LKHAQTCLYYDHAAWLPSSRVIKSFQELHSHITNTKSYPTSLHIIVDVVISNLLLEIGPTRLNWQMVVETVGFLQGRIPSVFEIQPTQDML